MDASMLNNVQWAAVAAAAAGVITALITAIVAVLRHLMVVILADRARRSGDPMDILSKYLTVKVKGKPRPTNNTERADPNPAEQTPQCEPPDPGGPNAPAAPPKTSAKRGRSKKSSPRGKKSKKASRKRR